MASLLLSSNELVEDTQKIFLGSTKSTKKLAPRPTIMLSAPFPTQYQGFSLGFWSLPQVEFHSNIFFQLGKLVHQLIPTVEIDSKRNSQYWEIDSQSNFHLWELITSLISISGN